MRIFQIILSNTQGADIRYANELYKSICTYFPEYHITQKTLSDKDGLGIDLVNLMNNEYDMLFIHALNHNRHQYVQIANYVNCKKILFVTNQTNKKFLSSINLDYIQLLCEKCDKIVFNLNNKDLHDTMIKFCACKNAEEKFIQLEYMYNFDQSIVDSIKYKEIVQISNKGLSSKYDLFIKLFQNTNEFLVDFTWKMYGVERNIQTYSIDKLFYDNETGDPSTITNFNTDYTVDDMINVYPTIASDDVKDILNTAFFACCFDKYNFINYTILDIIYSGAIPIFNVNYAKSIMINRQQSIYDIIKGIYITDDTPLDDEFKINVSKYILSSNTYKSTVLSNIRVCDQLFNPKKNTETLLKKIYSN